jgi:hypothetical protein
MHIYAVLGFGLGLGFFVYTLSGGSVSHMEGIHLWAGGRLLIHLTVHTLHSDQLLSWSNISLTLAEATLCPITLLLDQSIYPLCQGGKCGRGGSKCWVWGKTIVYVENCVKYLDFSVFFLPVNKLNPMGTSCEVYTFLAGGRVGENIYAILSCIMNE